MKLEYVWTEDDLRLMGAHYPGNDVCIVEVHGMSGNFIENYYANVLGEKLASQGYGFIYGHNRGYGHVNDISTRPVKSEDNGWNTTRIGEAYELFEDSPKDVDAWVTKARDLGYKKIILVGHSLGCNKVVYYLSQNPEADITGVILASPPDMVGLVELERYQPDHLKLLKQARELVEAGKPREMVDGQIWDWYMLSAQTYLSLFEQGGAADNLPVLRNPDAFEQLASIKQPILGIMGEHDDIEIRSLKEDIELIKSKATGTSEFKIAFIPGANHDYQNRETDFADVVTNWVTMQIAV
jgi:pimeloyl-ACP methyl ester carboxylesterase